MTRRRKRQSVNLMTAALLEIGTLIGMVAVAQPTWTRGLIEKVSAPPQHLSQPAEQTVAAQQGVYPPPMTQFSRMVIDN